MGKTVLLFAPNASEHIRDCQGYVTPEEERQRCRLLYRWVEEQDGQHAPKEIVVMGNLTTFG